MIDCQSGKSSKFVNCFCLFRFVTNTNVKTGKRQNNMPNQDPEQIARDQIDKQLLNCGWIIQDKNRINLNAGVGVIVRYYLTQDGKETDYVLFVDGKPVGVIEAKREEEGHKLSSHENQVEDYAAAKLKYLIAIRSLLSI